MGDESLNQKLLDNKKDIKNYFNNEDLKFGTLDSNRRTESFV